MKWTTLFNILPLAAGVAADPTWPSDIDELEEIMVQLTSFRARKFADTVSPCSNEASGPGRQNAAEWLRTAFHDMSTANNYFGTGGLDASLQYELTNGENPGPGHKTTLDFMSTFLSRKSSLSDLIALGVHTSVRSCGGPSIPFRAGRKDATEKGNTGVPQPQNSIFTFKQQFERMGFNNVEMIQLTACGHTLGGVHSQEFPTLVPPGAKNGLAGMDSSVAAFDNKVVTEYLSGKTKNPLVVGPSVRASKNSDFKVFNSDGNQTMEALADPNNFRDVCKVVLQKMIDVVPSGVTLTEPIVPYMVKPVNLQLTLENGGANLLFTGFIRVKTTTLPASKIKSLTITYKNRNGRSNCGSSCSFTINLQGIGRGFDDTFAFFPISTKIPVATGISSFTVTMNLADKSTTVYDNNGAGYPLQDAILMQMPQSCLRGSNGALTVVAAVHNSRLNKGAKAIISHKVAQPNSPMPRLKETTIALKKAECMGSYTFFRAEYVIPGGRAYESRIDVVNGDKSQIFKSASELGGTCRTFSNPPECKGGPVPVSLGTKSTSISTTSSKGFSTSTSSKPFTTTTKSKPGSAATPAALAHKPTVSPFTLVGCWTEASSGRALSQKKTSDDSMTNDFCANFCKGYKYFGTEYGKECYCGNFLAESSKSAPLDDCQKPCSGDKLQYCGGGSRLELYMNPDATGGAPEQPAAAGDFVWMKCQTEVSGRALRGPSTADDKMTTEMCAKFCKAYEYFGTEYGRECFCGNELQQASKEAPATECKMACGGDEGEFCGGDNRLSVYKKKVV